MSLNYAIILASGTGSRFGSELPKQFFKINSKTVLELSIEAFEKNDNIDKIILVITPEYRNLALEIISKNNYKKLSNILNGGTTRKDSSYIAINSIKDTEANVLIHDCARPLVSQKIIDNCIEAIKTHVAVGVAIPTTDTIWEVKNDIISSIPNRATIKLAQTPQCFKLSIIKKAHELAKNNSTFTDDCGLVVNYNLADIYTVEGDIHNIKITYPNDVNLALNILKNKNLD